MNTIVLLIFVIIILAIIGIYVYSANKSINLASPLESYSLVGSHLNANNDHYPPYYDGYADAYRGFIGTLDNPVIR